MALADILDRILGEARDEAGRIDARAEEEAAGILEEGRRKAEALRAKLVAEGRTLLRREEEKALARKRLEGKKAVLALKKELLDELFRSLPSGFRDRSPEEYAELLSRLPGDDLGGLPATVQVGRGDRESFGDGFTALVCAHLRKRFPRWELQADGDAGDFDGGVLIRTEKIVFNLSLERLLEGLRETAEMKVAATLFGKN